MCIVPQDMIEGRLAHWSGKILSTQFTLWDKVRVRGQKQPCPPSCVSNTGLLQKKPILVRFPRCLSLGEFVEGLSKAVGLTLSGAAHCPPLQRWGRALVSSDPWCWVQIDLLVKQLPQLAEISLPSCKSADNLSEWASRVMPRVNVHLSGFWMSALAVATPTPSAGTS